MKRLYEVENLTLREIAKRIGITYQAVHDGFVRAGIQLRSTGKSAMELDREILTKLYVEEKLTIGQVAQRLNVHLVTVSRELDRLGIPKRSRAHFRRKQPELYELEVGKSIILEQPQFTQHTRNLYRIAESVGAKISVKTLNDGAIRITRIESCIFPINDRYVNCG